MTGSIVTSDTELVELSAEIIAAYVSRNAINASDLPKLIGDVYATLQGLQPSAPQLLDLAPRPAVPVRKSVTPDYIVCLEDGKKFKSLKRHLRSSYNMSADEYRAKWGLPHDYPMVAPNYSQTRSELAKTNGLGRAPDTPRGRKPRKVASRAA